MSMRSGRGGGTTRARWLIVAATLLLGASPAAAAAQTPVAPLQVALAKLAATDDTLPQGRFPTATDATGAWLTSDARPWTSGFLPGQLWLAYEATGDAAWRTRAERRQAPIAQQSTRTDTHDLGFMVLDSFGHGHRLTGDTGFRGVVLTAANSLATRWNATVGAIRSWNSPDPEFRVIVDSLMNMELLLWAARNGSPASLRSQAVAHALKVLAHHVRPDGSTYHEVVFDSGSGAVRVRRTHQGAGDETTWARGQAWAVHGFTMLFRETRDIRFLVAARRVTDWYLGHLPADFVPWWDFSKNGVVGESRDSSAAAIAAGGLLELAQLESDAVRATRYRHAALATLDSLAGAYLDRSQASRSILLHGTGHRPKGLAVDAGLPYGDFFYLQALLRAGAAAPPPPPPPPPPDPSYAAVVRADSPAAHWRLGETAGTVAADVLARSPGAYRGAFRLGQPGAIGGDADTAVGLNGSDAFVSVPHSGALNTADVFTLEAWIKRATTQRSEGLLAKGSDGYKLYLNSSDYLVLRRNGTGDIARSTIKLSDRTGFHHVAATKSGSRVALYIDGVDRTGAVTNRTIPANSGSLQLGSSSGFFNGSLDEVAVYPRALTAADIARHHAAGS